ncbi:MAG: hypothetical protein IJM46_05390 [Oscillospiraceae bacterium]|nr:hypothetical protein [Oscillospiraceae bacterium]
MKYVFCASALALLTATALLTACVGSTAAGNEQKIGSELTIGVENCTAHAGDKGVPVSVRIWNNPGYAATGLQLVYDPALTPQKTGETSPNSNFPYAKCDLGEAAQGFMKSCLIGEENHLIAFGAMTSEDCKTNGKMFTVYFDIPDNAASGQQYKFSCNMDSLNNYNKDHLNPKTVEGTLTIE